MSSFLPLAGLLAGHRAPGHVTAFAGKRAVTWEEFAGRTAGLSEYIACQRARRWVLACSDPLSFAISLFAVWHARKCPIVPPSFQPGTLASIRDASDGLLDDVLVRSIRSARGAFAAVDPVATRLELYTSGSTGEPKVVTKQLRQLDAEVATLERLWGAALATATVVATVPHHHIYGLLFHLLWPLAAGRPFDNACALFPEALCERAAWLRDTALVSSPARLARAPELVGLEALQPRPRMVFSSGGPLAEATAELYLAALGCAPVEVYGSTETGGIAWRCQQRGDAAWTPLPGVTVTRDADGAVSVVSPHLPDATPFRAADLMETLPDGRFLLRGRLDRTIKIEEKRLSLGEMEERLRDHAWVHDAAVTMLQGRRQFLGAVVTLSEAGLRETTGLARRDLVATLRRHLRHYFEPVLLPRHWRFPRELPRNERGKIAQASLSALFTEEGHARAPS